MNHFTSSRCLFHLLLIKAPPKLPKVIVWTRDLPFKRQQRWGSCSNNSSLLNNTKWRWLLCAIWFWVQSIWDFHMVIFHETSDAPRKKKNSCFPLYQFYWLLNRDPHINGYFFISQLAHPQEVTWNPQQLLVCRCSSLSHQGSGSGSSFVFRCILRGASEPIFFRDPQTCKLFFRLRKVVNSSYPKGWGVGTLPNKLQMNRWFDC